jgi:purine-cytosine permease-like protein
MKISSQIFDTKNISDLPKSLVDELAQKSKAETRQDRILHLFTLTTGATLTASQICVGYWRTFGEELTLKQIYGTMYHMKKRGYVKKKNQLYEVVK